MNETATLTQSQSEWMSALRSTALSIIKRLEEPEKPMLTTSDTTMGQHSFGAMFASPPFGRGVRNQATVASTG